MNGPTVIAENIPRTQRERLAASLLTSVRVAFEDPKIQREFAEWQAKKKLKNLKN